MSLGAVVSAAVYAVMGLSLIGIVIGRHRQPEGNDSFAGVFSALLLALGFLLLIFANERVTAVFEHTTNIIRTDARTEGWYNTRREIQVPVLRDVVAALAVVFLLLLAAIRRSFARNFLFVAAFAYYLVFAAVELISLHQTDAVLGHRFASIAGIHWLDLAGLMLCLLAVGVAKSLNHRRVPPTPPMGELLPGLPAE